MPASTPENNALTQNPEIQQYFQSLPPYVQETIKQSGLEIQSKEQLQQCVNHLMQK